VNFDINAAMDALLMEERNRERYVPHPDTCRLLAELLINPADMGAPLVMGRRMADACIKRGMHPSDIVIVDRLPRISIEPEPGLSVMRRRGKGERKSGRLNRWNGRPI